MDRRIKPWVNKKIVEYIGEEEPTLTEFICQKVMAHSKPDVILNDVAMVSTWLSDCLICYSIISIVEQTKALRNQTYFGIFFCRYSMKKRRFL